MALYHDATITPTKPEMLAAWIPTQAWCPAGAGAVEVIGAFRFDDPEGQVGIETHVVRKNGTVMQVPFTYRSAPVESQIDALVGEMHHSALGNRWVYDGFADPRYLVTMAGTSMTGQGEALGMVVYDGEWFIAPSAVRLRGGGWSHERVSVDGFEPVSHDGSTVVLANDRFEMTLHRRLHAGAQPAIGLTAVWDGSDPVVLSEVRER